MKIAYDGAYFVFLVSNEDLYGLSERLRVDAAGRLQAARQGDVGHRLTPTDRTENGRERQHGSLHRTQARSRACVVIFGVTVFVFVVTRIIGDPVKFMLPLSATEEQRDGASGGARPRRAAPRAVRRRSSATSSRLDLGESTYVRGPPALDVVFDYLPAHAPAGGGSGC